MTTCGAPGISTSRPNGASDASVCAYSVRAIGVAAAADDRDGHPEHREVVLDPVGEH